MAALTDNKYDVYNWIIKVIDSCKSHQQIDTVNRLITNFRNVYDDYDLTGSLRNHAHNKQFR
jgi:uncharacterized protein (DUF608 family)